MTVIPLVRAEFARLTSSRMGLISLIALMTVPLFYGGLYLWGNQDPYSKLDKIPAALVVSDTGAAVDGKTVNYGRDAAKTLLKGDDFEWTEVSAATAAKGVKNGDYDFALSFPADFSTRLASASGDDPSAARLKLTTDDTNSYLSTTIAEKAAESVRVEIAKEVGATASIRLLDAVSSIRGGLITAQDGAGKLADGAATAATGASSLAAGTTTLSSGATSLASGLAKLDAQTKALPSSAAQLSSGASTLASKLATASNQTPALVTSTGQAAQLAAAVKAELAAYPDPLLQQQLAGLAALTSGVSSSVTGTVAPGLSAAAAGASQLAAGASTLNSSAPALASAVHSAATGAASLEAGASQAASGASDLSAGVDQLASGSKTLHDSLGDAVKQLPKTSAGERKTAANLIANPLSVDHTAITEAQNYGAGLAPFFMSLASWIGIYALFLLVRPLSRRALTAVRKPIRTTLAGWFTPAVLGIVQMIALFAIVTLALHMSVANPVGLLFFLAFVAVTFAAIVLALNVILGSVGQFLALIFMVIQLVTAGGTFPWQTLPGALAVVHRILPMSHAVDGIRQLMYGGLSAGVWSAIWPLLAWLVGSLLVAVLGALRQGRFRTLRELRPSPIGA